jgi:hypothetical protein
VVFRNNEIVFREDFDREKLDLQEQVPILRRYADYMLKYSPLLVSSLVTASSKPIAQQVVTSLSSFLTATRNTETKRIAQLQLPILSEYAAKTAENEKLREFHKNYSNWHKEMTYLSQRNQ